MDNELFSQVKAGNLFGTLESYANNKSIGEILQPLKPGVLKKLSQNLNQPNPEANDDMPSAEDFAISVRKQLVKLAKEDKSVSEKKGEVDKSPASQHTVTLKPFFEASNHKGTGR